MTTMTTSTIGRYADAALSQIELDACVWLDGFYQLEHLLCTRAWAMVICPEASAELKFAALVHDCERHFPGGPTSTPRNGFDDPDYLFAHSIRSADFAEAWLRNHACALNEEFIRRVRRLVLRHEIGGGWEADFVQAADSLSFLEVFDWLVVEWVRREAYTITQAREKLDFMVERIRPSIAVAHALPLYENIVGALEAADETSIDLKERRTLASSRILLLGQAYDPQGG